MKRLIKKGIATLIAVFFISFSVFSQKFRCETYSELKKDWKSQGYKSFDQAMLDYGMLYLSQQNAVDTTCVNDFYTFFKGKVQKTEGLMDDVFDTLALKYNLVQALEEHRSVLFFSLLQESKSIINRDIIGAQDLFMSFTLEVLDLGKTNKLKPECLEIYGKLETINTAQKGEIEKVKKEFDDCQKE